ncbi:MAG: acyl carrier protein [Gammaproteobacteria bacterium]|nr:acyl carrier protein [Gammaproteobacteria bacterium]
MKTEAVFTELARLLEIDRVELTLRTPLAGCGNWDSLAVVSMMATIDTHFNVTVKGHEVEQCKTINDLFLLIEHKKQRDNTAIGE